MAEEEAPACEAGASKLPLTNKNSSSAVRPWRGTGAQSVWWRPPQRHVRTTCQGHDLAVQEPTIAGEIPLTEEQSWILMSRTEPDGENWRGYEVKIGSEPIEASLGTG